MNQHNIERRESGPDRCRMSALIVALLTGSRCGFVMTPHGFARFRRGRLVDASPAIWNAYQLRAAHFEQIGF